MDVVGEEDFPMPTVPIGEVKVMEFVKDMSKLSQMVEEV